MKKTAFFFMLLTCLAILASHSQGAQADEQKNGGVGIEYPVCNFLNNPFVAKQLPRGERPNPYSPFLVKGGSGVGNERIVFCIHTKEGVETSASVALENATFIVDETKAVPMVVPLYKGKPQGKHNWFTNGDLLEDIKNPDAGIIVRLSQKDRDLVVNP